jgi:hypothetical protein
MAGFWSNSYFQKKTWYERLTSQERLRRPQVQGPRLARVQSAARSLEQLFSDPGIQCYVRGTIEVGRFAERGLKCRAALVGVSGNAVISKEILSWIGGPSALWKSANKLGISTGDKIYLSHALTEKGSAAQKHDP